MKEGAKKELRGRVLKTRMQDGSAGPSTDKQSSVISKSFVLTGFGSFIVVLFCRGNRETEASDRK